MPRPRPTRDAYAHFHPMTTRWRDNDVYAHVNNAFYYEFVDTCVNAWLIDHGGLTIPDGPVIGLVAETGCRFLAQMAFPDRIEAGLRVGHIGRSSVRYELALFRNDETLASAEAHFVHVYVDARDRRPTEIPSGLRTALERLQMP